MDNRLARFAQLALAVAERVLPAHGSKFAPGIRTQMQLLACLLQNEHVRLDYRPVAELLAAAG